LIDGLPTAYRIDVFAKCLRCNPSAVLVDAGCANVMCEGRNDDLGDRRRSRIVLNPRNFT